jgi:site-specific DNA recombinase
VQALLREKGKPRPKTHDFAFTGLIRCGECGCAITAEEITHVNKTDANVRHYVYYRCTKKNPKIKCKQSYIQVQDLEKYVDEFLATIELDEDFAKLAEEYAIKENKNESKTQSAILKKLHSAKEEIRAQINELMTKWLTKKIDDEGHKTHEARLLNEMTDIDEKIKDAERNAKNWLQLVKDTIHFSRNARLCFKNGTLDEKKIILKTIGSNLVLKDKKLYIEPQKLFKIVAQNKKSGNWQRGRDSNP